MANLREELKEALDSIRELGLDPDSPGGAAALSHLLQTGASGAPASGDRVDIATGEQSHGDAGADTPEARLAEWVGTDTARIRDIAQFDEDGALPTPPSGRLPRSKADRQRIITLLKLAFDRIGYGTEDVRASGVNAACSAFACLDQNLPNNILKLDTQVARRGKRGAFTYRATQQGMERARTLTRQLLDGTEELTV